LRMSDTHNHVIRDNLTESEAAARARRVLNVRYALHLSLQPKAETYQGELACEFDLAEKGAPIFLDFTGQTIRSLLVNGKSVATPDWNKHRLVLPEALLKEDENRVVIAYENLYSHTGSGFHQFQDPEDGREYIFSDFEPFNAHQLFPCFDQPDLKATYEVAVTAPEHWTIVSNGREVTTTPQMDGRTRRHFERTARFSTYLMAVIAGDFAVYTDTYSPKGREPIPLRILCRKALAKHIDPEEVFTVTKQGFAFYESLFDSPYPFVKYDQAFVPEFNAGAMENTAAVTHGEHMIFRGQVSETQRLNRAETVLHELAHMWFGDLVTMQWWKDLWLNESFATFISYLCLVRATRFKNAWETFHTKIKAWAMRQDELVTTHPIAGDVPDTDATFLNFDGITYGKGASVLKQLLAYIGEDGFRDGLRLYFQKFAYTNATLDDFLACLEEGSHKSLKEWSRLWIETSGLGSLGASLETSGGRIKSFAVVQEPASINTTLRPHQVEVALFRETATGRAIPMESASVLVSGARTRVAELEDKPVPVFVAVNHGDHAYAKVVLDALSLDYVKKNFERIDEPLVKATLWGSLWQMVRDRKMSAADYVKLVADKAHFEPSSEIVETLLGNAMTALVRYIGVGEKREKEARAQLIARSWTRLGETSATKDLQLTWLRATISLANAPADLDRLVALMDGAEKISGVEIDQDMRWSLIAKLIAFERPGGEARLEKERARDPSDKGKKSAFQCEASRPSPDEKARLWAQFIEGPTEKTSSDFLKNGMGRFHWAHQAKLLDPWVDKFFTEVTRVFEVKSPEYSKAFCLLLYPTYRAEQPVLDRSERLLEKTTNPTLKRMLREANDELLRSLRCRAVT
ncbi:MAG: aminopeptidase N, partial [Planctomycetota bacterium]